MKLINMERIQLEVDGTDFELTVQDYQTHWKVRVYLNGRVVGTKDLPFRVYPDNGVLTYTVRAIMRGQNEQASV